ncbi:proteasome subunit beta type-1-like [Styela clava]|uniref:proteasome subunit beta type-1-B-like n=1 Tax=Styela clava TaxID=7725 RepID=UPI00193A78A7|nr:proteasome subunit beta type-1-B-like [Styela clava]
MDSIGKLQTYGINAPKQQHFSPYASNGGNTLAISGDDFAIIAADTRLSQGFSIHSREEPKTLQLTPKVVLGAAGFHGDSLTLKKVIQNRIKLYEHEHGKKPSVSAIAAMLSTILYYKRFFPYYVYNLLAGIDDEGKGCVYSYDPVGCYEREAYRAEGSAAELLQPLLDNQIGFKNMENVPKIPLTKQKGLQLVKDAFISAAERDITTGDSVLIHIIDANGVKTERFPLRRD